MTLSGTVDAGVQKPVILSARQGASAKPPRRAYSVAVTSGKGGVGKTNIAVGLATLLSRRHKVVLIDGDMGLANANVLCGVAVNKHMGHMLMGQCELQDVMYPTSDGFQLVPGGSGISSMAALDAQQRTDLLSDLEPLQSSADVLLFDTAAGIGKEVLIFTRHVDHVVLVTTPEPTAMLDAYAVLKVLTREGVAGRISIVVNQVKSEAEAVNVHSGIISVARQFLKTEVPLMGYVLLDNNVSAAVRQRKSFVRNAPNSPAANSLRSVSHAIERFLSVSQAQEVPSFFRRLLSRWQ